MKAARDLTLFRLLPQSADLAPTPRLCVATVSWADQGGKPGFLQGVKQQGLSFCGAALAETVCSRQLCHLRCAETLEPVLSTAWCAQVYLTVNANLSFLARCLPAAPRIFVYLS